MQKKKIILIGPAYPYRGGNSLFISHLYDKLKDDFEVKVYNYKLLYPSLLFPGKTQYDKSNNIIKQAPNERVVNSINPFNWISTAAKINKENADLVVFNWWHPFFSFCHFSIRFLIKKKYKKKILIITENIISHEGSFVDKFLTKFGLADGDAYLALSKKVINELKNYTKKKVYESELPIYDCYDSENEENFRANFNLQKDDEVLLFFGYIRKYKGLDLLIEAFSIAKKTLPKLKLLIAGEFYDDPSSYLQLIDRLNLRDDVILRNEFIPNEEVIKYYRAADVVVLPYRSATQSGILNSAYGFNKPVIVTNVGGLSEFMEDKFTGILVDKPNADEIANGIVDFYTMRESINFENNVKTYIKSNKFESINKLFGQIINEML